MTEQEWLECTDPSPMLPFLRGKGSERNLRLLGCASVRRVWHMLTHKHGQRAVELAERYADGLAHPQALHQAAGKVQWQMQYASNENRYVLWAARDLANTDPQNDMWLSVCTAIASVRCSNGGMKPLTQASLLRDTFGNPFRPVSITSSWLKPIVTNLATLAYEKRALPSGELDPLRLAVLADALEDSGCQDAGILGHLRHPGPHVRGCWGLDLLLGKE